MLWMIHPLAVALAMVGNDTAGLRPGCELHYHGAVAPLSADRTAGQPQKTFDLRILVAAADPQATRLLWTLDERGHGAWPWPDRFGEWTLDARGAASGVRPPSLLFDYGDGESAVPLPAPWFAATATLSAGAKWSAAGSDYEVLAAEKLADRDVWPVQVRNAYGAKRKLWVEVGTSLVAGVDERIFMNKGSEYQLQVRLAEVDVLSPADLAAVQATFSALLALRDKLGRGDPAPESDWNSAQLASIAEALPALEKASDGGPLAKLVAAAARDVKLQTGRADEVAELIARSEGSPVRRFSVPGLQGGDLTEGDLKGQVTVLHFWDYRHEPLKEPYGQVGYLEFLYTHRKEQGLRVYGVAVDGRLNDDAGRRTALAGMRKLRAFMNLTYPLLLDGGDWIKDLGDPRLVGAVLPLVVVVGRDGKIAHYHVGYYDVDRQVGLKQLDAIVARELAK